MRETKRRPDTLGQLQVTLMKPFFDFLHLLPFLLALKLKPPMAATHRKGGHGVTELKATYTSPKPECSKIWKQTLACTTCLHSMSWDMSYLKGKGRSCSGGNTEQAPHNPRDSNQRERASVLWSMQDVSYCKSQLRGSCCGNHTFLKTSWQIKHLYTLTPFFCT